MENSIITKLALEIYKLGEAIHGSDKEKIILNMIKNHFQNYEIREIPVSTKEWVIESQRVYINEKEIGKFSVFPYSKGSVKGKIGNNVIAFSFPDHPFKVKDLYKIAVEEGAEGIIFYENDKIRRIVLPESKIPVIMLPFKPTKGSSIEIDIESYLKDSSSYNLEIVLRDGNNYILLGAHVDHWLSGFHDNIFSIDILSSIENLDIKNHGIKLAFFSSEEGPRCCTGSYQHPKNDLFISVILDALFPNRVVYSSTPNLWEFSKFFKLKRIEMPSPFSDNFNFIQSGIPSLLLYNDDLIPYYHSNSDIPLEIDKEYKIEIIEGIKKLIFELDKLNTDELEKMSKKYGKWSRIMPDYLNLSSMFEYV